MDQTRAFILASAWIDAWNSHDLDLILSHYADDVFFRANTVVLRWHRADGVLRGRDELREHFRRGLELAPDLHFVLEEVFTCPAGYAVLYRRVNGNRVIDIVEPDEHGRAKRVEVFYAGHQP